MRVLGTSWIDSAQSCTRNLVLMPFAAHSHHNTQCLANGAIRAKAIKLVLGNGDALGKTELAKHLESVTVGSGYTRDSAIVTLPEVLSTTFGSHILGDHATVEVVATKVLRQAHYLEEECGTNTRSEKINSSRVHHASTHLMTAMISNSRTP